MASNKKSDPSALFSNSISIFTKSATKVFNDFQTQVRGEVARAEAETRQVRKERDEALRALQEARKELQQYKDEVMECKANIKEAELTIRHHVENYALLQRETNQWKDQAKNWQEHFLRVEQERCSLSSRMDELVTERLIVPPVTPKVSTSKPHPSSCSTNGTSMPRPPTYQSAAPSSTNREAGSSQSPLVQQNSRSANGRTTKRKVPSKSELPPYSEVVQTPQTNKTSAFKSTTRSNRKPAAASSRAKRTAPAPPAAATAEPLKQPQQPQQIFIRRVHAVVEVKQEEESDEDLNEPPPPESPEESLPTPRRSRNSRRARQIVEDDDEYVPDDASPELGSNEDAEDDELMIGAGDDLSFDVSSSSTSRQASKASPNKRRKIDTSTTSKPKVKRKT